MHVLRGIVMEVHRASAPTISMSNNRKWGNPTSRALWSLLPYLNLNMLGKYHYSYSSKSHTDPESILRKTQGL